MKDFPLFSYFRNETERKKCTYLVFYSNLESVAWSMCFLEGVHRVFPFKLFIHFSSMLLRLFHVMSSVAEVYWKRIFWANGSFWVWNPIFIKFTIKETFSLCNLWYKFNFLAIKYKKTYLNWCFPNPKFPH